MSPEVSPNFELEIAYVLFMDVVGYSKLLVDEQRDLLNELNQIVRNTKQFENAEAAGKLTRLPTGDGMALAFFTNPEGPVKCALEVSEALQAHPRIRLRMGIHCGPVSAITDVNNRSNIAGAGINIAQRVMDCGDAGHILLSKRIGEDLAQYRNWQPYLHDIGECLVKHDLSIGIVNLYHDNLGNPALPEKVRKAQREPTVSVSVAHKTAAAWRWIVLIAGILLLAAGIGWFRYGQRSFRSSAGESIPPKSIAVLPFENFSDDKENAFFADGIQDDILTSLAEIHDLRVISRTSVESYRGQKQSRNLREIGKTLGVANILEGSVRREGNRVVVNVQLIDALHDRHIWANRYDRTLADSLGLQGELASEIASALQATFRADEKARLETKPTDNADAYVFYLRANQIARNPDTLLEDYNTAEQLYRQAITLDPKFALAHARLASTCAQIFHFYEPLDSWKAKAREQADLALQLQPNLAEARFALGQCIYWIDENYDRALEQFYIALGLSPSNGEVSALIAAIKRRQGDWQKSLDAYQNAQKIDPQNANIARNIVFNNTALRRWPEAARAIERMRAMAPTSLVARIQSGYVDFWGKGDTRLLKRLLDEVPAGVDPDGEVTACRWDVAMIERDYSSATNVIASSPLAELSYMNGGATPKSFFQGLTLIARGDTTQARPILEAASITLQDAVKEAPGSADRHANLGLVYAFLGRKEDAIAEGRRAVELKPESKDAVDGPIMGCYLALIYTRVGEKDLAFSLLKRLLQTPGAVDSVDYSATINDLKYRWEWDPIRGDPRFQQLIAESH